MLQASDTVEYHSVEAGVFLKGIQAIVQAVWLGDLAVLVDGDIAVG